MRPRCNYSVHKMKSVQVYVLVSSFNNKDQKLPGGAFYIINCAVSCNYTSFENCTSHGAGGAIYIKNYKNLSNNVERILNFENQQFYVLSVYINRIFS